MKKLAAMVMVIAMMLALGATAFAEGHALSLNEAKQAALDYVGVRASAASFTKAQKVCDAGRDVFEIAFHANGTEYSMDVDASTGAVSGFGSEYCGGQDEGCGDDRYDPYDDWDYIFDRGYDVSGWDD